jgi:hypothetical protein
MNHFWSNLTLNKQVFRALAFVALALSVFSCEKSNGTIGSGNFVDDRPELGTKLSFPVVSYTTAWDSIVTSSPARATLGKTFPKKWYVYLYFTYRVLCSNCFRL